MTPVFQFATQVDNAKSNGAEDAAEAEMVGWLRQGVGELIRQAGLQLVGLLMEEEVRALAGERSQPQAERKANRWGTERGY
jgi:hypothetical protein